MVVIVAVKIMPVHGARIHLVPYLMLPLERCVIVAEF